MAATAAHPGSHQCGIHAMTCTLREQRLRSTDSPGSDVTRAEGPCGPSADAVAEERAVRPIALHLLWFGATALLMLCAAQGALAQLHQDCTVSVLYRNVQANPDGSWV